MDLTEFGARSSAGPYREAVTGLESLNFSNEFRQLVTMPPDNTGSFTALLEMPATQAMELFHFTDTSSSQATRVAGDIAPPTLHPFGTLTFPSDSLLLDRAARYSVIASEHNGNFSGESVPSNSSAGRVKPEPDETDSSQRFVSYPMVENQNQNNSSCKRKERGKKVKKTNSSGEEAEKLPYFHVRARRGQATNNHSLAERARREKINARMKLLQELVPGCDKIQGTALVLDEIINHVQSLQRQVEMLSMRLAAVNPRIDFNLDSILASENVSLMDGSFNGESYHHHQMQQWPLDGYHQLEWGREEGHHQANFLMDSDTLHPNQIQGTALVLDEIINHVQSLQRQVEMLSMRLAAVNPRTDFNFDSILASENVSLMDGTFNGESYHHQLQQWPLDGYHQLEWGREEDHHQANFLMDSDTLHPNQVKMEL